MTKPTNRSLFNEHEVSQDQATTVLEWIARSYQSLENWKKEAENIFYSLNGQSEAARNRLALKLRDYFSNETLSVEEVKRWNRNHTFIETVRVTPPKISATRLAYIDWCYVADYLLLSCAVESASILVENQRRANESRIMIASYDILCAIFEARKIINGDSGFSNQQVLKMVKKIKDCVTLTHIQEARRQERNCEPLVQPRIPPVSVPMARYTAIYT